MDGTLLDLNFDICSGAKSCRSVTRTARLSVRTRSKPRATLRAKEGTLEWYCLDHWARDLGMDLKRLKHDRAHIRFLPRAQDSLARVARAVSPSSIVTNAHRDTFAVKAEHTGIDRLVDRVVSSHDFAPKESAAFWHALERYDRLTWSARCCSRTAWRCWPRRAPTASHTVAIRGRIRTAAARYAGLGVDGVFELV